MRKKYCLVACPPERCDCELYNTDLDEKEMQELKQMVERAIKDRNTKKMIETWKARQQ